MGTEIVAGFMAKQYEASPHVLRVDELDAFRGWISGKHPSYEEKAQLRNYANGIILKALAQSVESKIGNVGVFDYGRSLIPQAPRIFAGFSRLYDAETLLGRIGVKLEKIGFELPEGAAKSDLEDNNIKTKEDFNRKVDEEILKSHEVHQITGDYDILSTQVKGEKLDDVLHFIENPENRKRYVEIGDRRIEAMKTALGRNSKISVLMRVFDHDAPYAVNTASRLIEAGVSVFSYNDEGERLFAIDTFEYVNNVSNRLSEIFETHIDSVKAGSSLPERNLTAIRNGSRLPTVNEARELQQASEVSLITEDVVNVLIYRGFDKPGKTAEVPQMHSRFDGLILSGWTGLHNNLLKRHCLEAEDVSKSMSREEIEEYFKRSHAQL